MASYDSDYSSDSAFDYSLDDANDDPHYPGPEAVSDSEDDQESDEDEESDDDEESEEDDDEDEDEDDDEDEDEDDYEDEDEDADDEDYNDLEENEVDQLCAKDRGDARGAQAGDGLLLLGASNNGVADAEADEISDLADGPFAAESVTSDMDPSSSLEEKSKSQDSVPLQQSSTGSEAIVLPLEGKMEMMRVQADEEDGKPSLQS
jgi:hypothetical protein